MTRKKKSPNTKSKKSKSKLKPLATNRRALYNYEVLDKYEVGISLLGQEVKSAKSGQVSLRESFIQIEKGEMWLWNCNISKWTYSTDSQYDPVRKRKLLMKRSEIDSLEGKVKEKGLSLIPLKMYLKRGIVKLEMGLCKGRKRYDKRRVEKERTMKRELHEEKRKFMV